MPKNGEQSSAAPHFLQHDLELGQAEPVAAVVAGQRQAGQPELAGHLVPHPGRIVPGLHGGTDGGLRGLGREKLADGLAQIVQLFLAIVHDAAFPDREPAGRIAGPPAELVSQAGDLEVCRIARPGARRADGRRSRSAAN